MKAKKLLIFLFCFVLLVASLAVVASAKGATDTASAKETTNSDGTVTIVGYNKPIPSTYASKDSYPFVLYKFKDREFNGDPVGYATMTAAIDAAKSNQQNNKWNATDKTYTGTYYSSVIVLRKNYTTGSTEKYDNYAQTMGEVIVDLNGFTLTQGGAEGLFYRVTNKPWGNPEVGGRGVYETEFTFKNGDIAVKNKPVFYGNMWNCTYYDENGNVISSLCDANGNSVSGIKIQQNTDGTYSYVDEDGNALTEVYSKINNKVTKINNVIHRTDVANMANKYFIWNFNNVTFKYVSGATTANMLMDYAAPQGTALTPPTDAAPFDFNFTDCTFDLTNAPAKDITLFNANARSSGGTDYWIKTTVNVNGCEIVAPAPMIARLRLASVEPNHSSSVNFNAGSNGDVFTLVLSDGQKPVVPTASSYVTVNGKQLYWHNVGGKYVLTECTAATEDHTVCSCGLVSGVCVDENADNVCDICSAEKIGGTWLADEDADGRPFVILDSKGNYKSTQVTWKEAVVAAAKINGSTILMRADYTTLTSDASTNLKTYSGEFTVDLNGHTLTRGYNGQYFFDNYWAADTSADTITVTFKNGTMLAEKWFICLSGDSNISNAKTANFIFDNVNLKFAAKNDKTDGWLFVAHTDKTYNKTITANITFTDCTFDTTDMRSSIDMNKAPALNLDVNNKNGDDYIKVKLTVNGGKIIANRFEKNALYQLHSDDIVIFGKGTDNEYLTLEMPDGKAPNAPTTSDYFVVEEKNTYFHKTGNVYTLTECLDSATHHECTCGVVYTTECIDENKNHDCDICGAKSDCIDEDKNHVCDLCDKTLACIEIDTNNDHVCDSCGEKFDFIDVNHDELCDHCGYVVNDYGIVGISETYASTEKYPFFVLKLQNGVYTFEKATSTLYGRQSGGAVDYAIYTTLQYSNKYNMETKEYEAEGSAAGVATAIVVMRRDYAAKMGNDQQPASEGVEWHNNIAHAQGEIIIDLGGHTLSEAVGSNKSVFTATVKGWTGSKDGVYTSPSTYTFKNGNVRVINYAFATVGTNDQVYTDTNGAWSIANNPFTLEFENVNFGFAAGATTASLAYANGGATNKNDTFAKVNVSFTGCTFDIQTNAPTTAFTLVNNSDNGKDVESHIVVNGCEIIASSMANVTVYKTATTHDSSLSVEKGDNGKYITLTMPKGSTAPAVSNTVTLDSGVVAAFVKSSTIGGNDNYQLYPAVMIGYKVKTSVTLYSNFVYNIYIPKANVNSFTVNDKTVAYNETKIDGVDYYHVAVNIPAAECLNDIALKVTLNSGSTTVDAGWTLSVLKYAGAVIGGSYDDVTKLLMKDMLVYASAAHTYFKNELGATKANTVEALLGTYSAEMPNGTAVKPSNKTYFTSAEVYVGEVPSFRFYLAGDYTADDFVFTVGGKEVDVTEEGGYVEIVMYAYMMLENVSFTVKGTEVSESYNLYSYLAYAKTLNDKNLVAVVEGLMKYSASAKNYRDYVIENTCYHSYVDGKCTKCGGDDPDVGTMSINAPASIYSNYAGKDISVTFSKSWYKGEVTWSTDNANVKVENGKIFAVEGTPYSVFPKADQGSKTVTITATTEHHTATATVDVSTFNGDGHNVYAEEKVQYYEKNIIKEENKGGMIFVGDSYFDGDNAYPNGTAAFWKDFYQDYAGQKAFLMGISSSRIEDLEVVSERIVYPMEPSEIVVHIGFNDVHASATSSPAPLDVNEIIARIQALLEEYHEKLPGAKIYYCGVEPKKTGYESNSNFYASSTERAPALAAAMEAFAATNEWLVYVNTLDIVVREDGTINKSMYLATDESHFTLPAYDVLRITLNEYRGVKNDGVVKIENVDGSLGVNSSSPDSNIAGIDATTTKDKDFIITGKVVITDFAKEIAKSNAHLQFRFNSNPDCRFVLWDNGRYVANGSSETGETLYVFEEKGDGLFAAGRICKINGASANISDKTKNADELVAIHYDANLGLAFEWAIIVQDGHAYWYINGKCVQEIPVTTIAYFNIGASKMDVTVYDIKVSMSDDADYEEQMAKYSDNVILKERYNYDSGITPDSTPILDEDGNNLTGNYVVSGTLDLYRFKYDNAHLQFHLASNYRFLLWDKDHDGIFTADDKTELFYGKSGPLTLDWMIIVQGNKAYWYINGTKVHELTAAEGASFTHFKVGAQQMDVLFYNIEVVTESANSEAYNALVSEYVK